MDSSNSNNSSPNTNTHSLAHSKDSASTRSTSSLTRLPNSAPDLLCGGKVEASVSTVSTNDNCDWGTTLPPTAIADGDDAHPKQVKGSTSVSSASQSLESIIRKSSHSSLASVTAQSHPLQTLEKDQSDMAANSPDQPMDDIPGDLTTGAEEQLPSQEMAASPAETPEQEAQETAKDTVEPTSPPRPRPTPTRLEQVVSNTSERRSSLSALATWWTGGSAVASTLATDQPPQYTRESKLAITSSTPSSSAPMPTSSPSSSSTTAVSNRASMEGMDWEPTGPEAAYIQRTQAKNNTNPCSTSLPSSATFPSSMIKHSKLATSINERRGSSSSAHGSITTMLWSKFAPSHENVTATGSSIPAPAEDDRNHSSTLPLQQTSHVEDMEHEKELGKSSTLSSFQAQETISTPSSSRKRWSIFGYGAKEDDQSSLSEHPQPVKRGNVLVEPESKPLSTFESQARAVTEPSTPSSNKAPSTKSVTAQDALDEAPANVKSEVAGTSDSGLVAPALVGTSELNVVVPVGEQAQGNRKDVASGTVTSTSSWLSIIPGYRAKSESISQEGLSLSHQVTDYEEGERKDIHGNTIKLGAQQQGRTFAELAQARNSKEALELAIDAKQGPRQTFGELKERDNVENASLAKDAGKAVSSLARVITKRKNIVLPSYYEQFPDVRPSLLTLPFGKGDEPRWSSLHQRSPSIVQSAFGALSSLLFSKPSTPVGSPALVGDGFHRETSGVQKVVIFGIHGWFPTKLVRTVIGEPTGTSKKFCDEMDRALKDYLKQHNMELDPGNITLIPLEGEGKVMDRVEILYQNLVTSEPWKQALHEADLVLVATHSQGTPTSILLMARLIEEGLLRVKADDPLMQRIGILTMAGISHGPFPFLKGNLIVRWFEAEAASELFEFMDSETEIAKKFREGLKTVLSSGVRLTCVASLEDQVVPLYSAVMTSISHPSIVRAVYIDGISFQNDFLTNLISFSLRLRNTGVDDHGVLVHLSEVIAGSIYGEGHSTIYEERDVYLLAIRSLLEPPNSLTPELARSEPIMHPFCAQQRLNPFYLPWGMRGVMEEIKSRGDSVLNEELERLKSLYDDWNPVSKGMKEIKFRLEPVRTRL